MSAVPVVPGTVLMGKYRIDRVVGTGGMGVVVAATHLALAEPVAMKFLHPEMVGSKAQVRRFLREARAVVRLKGEHVARVIDVGTLSEGVPYIVMEYLQGNDLGQLLQRDGPLEAGQAVDYLLQACEALAEAHELGIIHRDVKPANLFITRRPDGSALLKVLDFGVSKAPVTVDAELTRTQTVVGTPLYMSPEQMRSSRDVDGRSDVWSLGIVLYECLSGRRPFQGDSYAALCLSIAMDSPPPLRGNVVPELSQIVDRCLEKEPDARFATVAELAAALAPHAANPRAAAVVVERTAALQKRVAPATLVSGATPTLDQDQTGSLERVGSIGSATTLGGSAAAVDRRHGRTARAVGGAALGVGAVVAIIAVVAVVAATLGGAPDGRSVAGAGDGPVASAQPDASAPVDGAGPAPAVAVADVHTVVIQFMIQPATAKPEIWIDGDKLRSTEIEVPQSRTRRLAVKIVAPGYQPYEAEPLPISDLAISVVLTPTKAAPRGRGQPADARPSTPRVKRVEDI